MPFSVYHLKEKIEPKLLFRTILFFVISIVVLCISIFHVITDSADILFAIIGFVVGFGLGSIAARMRQIYWDKNAAKVFSRFDTVGVVILVLYILFEVYRERIVADFVDVQSVIAVSFAILSGLMLGRVFGMNRKILEVMEKNKVQ